MYLQINLFFSLPSLPFPFLLPSLFVRSFISSFLPLIYHHSSFLRPFSFFLSPFLPSLLPSEIFATNNFVLQSLAKAVTSGTARSEKETIFFVSCTEAVYCSLRTKSVLRRWNGKSLRLVLFFRNIREQQV